MKQKERETEDINVERVMRESAKYWGNFETAQDRKYFLWDQLNHVCNKRTHFHGDPFRVTLSGGSNQVILKRGDKTIYHSDFDDLGGMEDFILFFTAIVNEVEAGRKHEKAEGSGEHIFHIPL